MSLLVSFNLTDDPQLYGLEVSFTNILKTGLFHGNFFLNRKIRKGGGWTHKICHVVDSFCFSTKDLLISFADGEGQKIVHFLWTS